MLDSIANQRPSRRCSLCLASLITAVPLATPLSAEPPWGRFDFSVATQPLAPKRLPSVTPNAADMARSVKVDTDKSRVQTCSAEFDQLVESWFTEPDSKDGDDIAPARWLRSTSSSAAAEVARRLVGQATREFEVGAWMSAETSAWNAVRWAAESVDLAARERGEQVAATSLRDLQVARDAIREARDFSGVYGPVNGEAIERMALSHQTDVLDHASIEGLTATDASDRYLDHARILLAPIARQSIEAAQGMDLLAAIQLGRADAATLPSATALCLRRAALQGQPGNASLASRLGMHLADLGLLAEARWALEHSLAIENDPKTANALVQVLQRSGQHDQAARLLAQVQSQLNGSSRLATSQPGGQVVAGESPISVPEIVELSPQEFAAISQSVIPAEKTVRTIPATPASTTIAAKGTDVTEQDSITSIQASKDNPAEQPGMIRRFFRSLKRVW